MAITKFSRQRQAILDYLHSTKTHPTAEEVYSTIQLQYPNISLGTVYRNLNMLSDTGVILKLDLGDGQVHFDGDISNHYHCKCTACGRILDINMPSIDIVNTLAQSAFDGTIEGHQIFFYGKCSDCNNLKNAVDI